MAGKIKPGDTVHYNFELGGDIYDGQATVESEIHLDGPWFEGEEGKPFTGYNLDSEEHGRMTVHESCVEAEDSPWWKFW